MKSYELIWEHKLYKYIILTTGAYDYKMNDLINQEMDTRDELLQFQNVGSVRGTGVELAVKAVISKGIGGYASYSHQSIKNLFAGEGLPNSPSHLWKAGMTLPISDYLSAGMDLQYYSSRETIRGSSTDGFCLANVNFVSAQCLDHLKFSIRIKNVFNTPYSYPGGNEHLQSKIYQDRRTFSAKLEYVF